MCQTEIGFPEKVLKRGRLYVVLERNALDKLARKRRKQENIQNRIVGSIFTFKEWICNLIGNGMLIKEEEKRRIIDLHSIRERPLEKYVG